MLYERDCVLAIYSCVTPYASKYAKTRILAPHDKACLLLRTVTCWRWAKISDGEVSQMHFTLLVVWTATILVLTTFSLWIVHGAFTTIWRAHWRWECYVFTNKELLCNYSDKYIVCGTSVGKFDTCWSTHPLHVWFTCQDRFSWMNGSCVIFPQAPSPSAPDRYKHRS